MTRTTWTWILMQTLSDLLVWGLLYACFVLGYTGAGNVLQFLAWYGFGVSLILTFAVDSKKLTAKQAEKLTRPKAFRQWVLFSSSCEAMAFIWFDWWLTGGAYLVYAVLMSYVRDKAQEKSDLAESLTPESGHAPA